MIAALAQKFKGLLNRKQALFPNKPLINPAVKMYMN